MIPTAVTAVELQIRRFVLALLTLGLVGTGAELIALEHFDDQLQLVPFIVIGLGLAAVLFQVLSAGERSVRALRAVAILMLVTGAAGIVLHFRGNMEFQLESNPGLSGWALWTKILHSKVPPAMAPGVMAQLGLLALTYCFRHPLSRRRLDSVPE